MRYAFVVPALILLASCSGQQEPVAVPSSPAVSQEGLSKASETAVAWHATLPGGVWFDVPAHLRSDTISQTSKGATRRKLTFELLEAGPERSEAVVTAALSDAGYAAGPSKPGKDGKFSIQYKKSKAPTITATFFPELARTPANPDSKSMVSLSWQTKAAPKKAKKDA